MLATLTCHRGDHLAVEYLVLHDGSCPVKTFLDSFTDPRSQHGRERARVLYTVEKLSSMPPGRFLHEEAFKAVTDWDGLFEIKAYQMRVFCFYAPGKRLVLVDGVIKKKTKAPRNMLDRSLAFRQEYLAQAPR